MNSRRTTTPAIGPAIERLESRTLFSGDGLGDSLATAKDLGQLTSPVNVTAADSVSGDDVQDIYKFQATGPGKLQFSLTGLIADADLQLLNSAGKVIKKGSNNGNKPENFSASITPGTYYLNVFATHSAKTGFASTPYTLGISGTLAVPPPPAPPATPVNTDFLADTENLPVGTLGFGQKFTLTQTTSFVLRFAADSAADCYVFSQKDLDAFNAGKTVPTFVNFLSSTGGEKTVTLTPGDYVVGMRNRTSSINVARYELDYAISLPGMTRSYAINPLPHTIGPVTGAGGGKLVQAFTVKANTRYFLDGANTGVTAYVIPASQLSNFQRGPNFQFLYSNSTTDAPGFVELNLPPGQYYVAFVNPTGVPKTAVFDIEAWS